MFRARTVFAAAPSTALSQRYVVLLNGIRSSSDGSAPLGNSFEKIQTGLREIGVNRFVYFSYSAAWHMQVGDLYCSGWGEAGCSRKTLGDLSALDLNPVYSVEHTKLPPDRQAEVLNWLLTQIVKADPSAQIDLVGFSLGGIVASRWAALYGATSPLRSHIHGLVVVESPVGGIYGARSVLEGGFRGSLVTAGIKDMFGADVLRALQIPEAGVTGSIVASLEDAAKQFSFISIQSTIDYLVNSTSQAVCAGSCWIYKDYVVIGAGTQNWMTKHVRHMQNLGGRQVAPGETVGVKEFFTLTFDNHSQPLNHSQTVEWIKQAISTNPIIAVPGSSSTIVKAIATPTIPVKPDIIFLADTTGSMGGAIANVQSKATAVMQQVKAVQPDAQFGVADYKDFLCDAIPYRLSQRITNNSDAVVAAINTWSADGGCDWPEAQLNALHQLATNSGDVGWRTNSSRIIAWFGDAPGHDPSNGVSLNGAISALKAANVRVIAVDVNSLNGCAETCSQASAITTATGGRLIRTGTGTMSVSTAKASTLEATKQTSNVHTLTSNETTSTDDVAGAILEGLQTLSVTVKPQTAACASNITMTFDPTSITVMSGETATFNVTTAVAPGASGSTCLVNYLLNDTLVANDSSFSTPVIVPISWSTSPPLTTAMLSPVLGENGEITNVVDVMLVATDNSGGAGVRHITYSATGAEPTPLSSMYGSGALIRLSKPGQTRITFYATDNAGNIEAEQAITVDTSGVTPVTIDIKPGEIPNAINPKAKGVVPVAILTTPAFDAASVDPVSLRFGPKGAVETHNTGHLEDVDFDGDTDMLLHFPTIAAGIARGDSEACLTGKMKDGLAIKGCDTIKTVP